MDNAIPNPRLQQVPEMMVTQHTPPSRQRMAGLPNVTGGSGLSNVSEQNPSADGKLSSQPPSGLTLGLNRSRSNTGNSSNNSWTNSESGWVAAVNQAVQRDNDFVDEWQRSMDVLLIFVSDSTTALVPRTFVMTILNAPRLGYSIRRDYYSFLD